MSQDSIQNKNLIKRLFFCSAFLIIALLQIFVVFKGLNHPEAMDQAQIARQIARGEGFTTKFIRPQAFISTEATTKGEALPTAFPDTYQAPLYPYLEATVFSVLGAKNAELWKMNPGVYVYHMDRIIAGISTFFFFTALLLSYFLIKKIFDSTIATLTSFLLLLSNTFWGFALSGLPQMLMLNFFLITLLFLYTALEQKEGEKHYGLSLLLSAVSVTALCLTHWIGVWIALGLILYVAFAFRPRGLYAFSVMGMVLVGALFFLIRNYLYTGNFFGTAFYCIYEGLQGAEASALRTLELGNVPFQSKELFLRLFSSAIAQSQNLYTYLGGILVAPFFFLAFLHSFRKPAVNSLLWAVGSMWLFASLGMAIYGVKETISSNQILILFSPIMTAYGLTFVLILLSRINAEHLTEKQLRWIAYSVIFLISSGPIFLELPKEIRVGLYAKEKGLPHWPPYYPLGINDKIPSLVRENEVVATDQPWAVAWYGDRLSYWLPKSLSEFDKASSLLRKKGSPVSGILITPTSHGKKGFGEIINEYEEFTPFVLEGTLLGLNPKNPIVLVEMVDGVRPLRSEFGGSKNRLPILGTQMMFYSSRDIPESLYKR